MAFKSRFPANKYNFIRLYRVTGATLADLPVKEVEAIKIIITPPVITSATPLSTSSIRVNWTHPDATSFVLEYSTDQSTWTPVNIGNVRTYDVTGLNDGVEYFFRIKTDSSNYSNEVSATTPLDFRTALASDGVNDYLNVPDLSAIPTYPLTFSFWLKNNGEVNPDREIFASQKDNNDVFVIRFRNGSFAGAVNLSFITWSTDTSGALKVLTFNKNDESQHLKSELADTWYHWGMTLEESPTDNTKVRIKQYYNGLLGTYDLGNGVFADYVEILKTEIGTNFYTNNDLLRNGFDNNRFYNGVIDNFAIISDVLTLNDFQSIYNGGSGSKHLENNYNPQLFYKFNEAAGNGGGDNTAITAIVDSSGNGRNATLSNFAKTGTTSNWINH